MKRLGKFLCGLFGASILVSAVLVATAGADAADSPPRWKTGAAFQRALAAQFRQVNWSRGNNLRDRLQRLGQSQQVAVFLDRRIDPTAAVAVSAQQITLAELLDQMATQVDAVTLSLGSVVYVGPRDKIAGLIVESQQRAREAAAVPGPRGKALLALRSWKWEELSEPRNLLAELALEAGVTIEGIDAIAHDLWPETDLPPLRWTDRMSLLLAGFGLTFELAERGTVVRIKPFPRQGPIKRSYTTALAQPNLEQLARQFPLAKLQRSPSGITFEGTAEEHERLRKLLTRQTTSSKATPSKTGSSQAKTVHSLRVNQQQVGAIIKTLERQLQLRVEVAPGARQKLYERVSFDLTNVSLDELLSATLAPAGLAFRRDGDVIRIRTQE